MQQAPDTFEKIVLDSILHWAHTPAPFGSWITSRQVEREIWGGRMFFHATFYGLPIAS